MKIALVGYGKMGKAIDALAPSLGIEVVSRIDPSDPKRTHDAISAEALAEAAVCIEFTHPDAALGNIEALAALKKNIVIGTTGWYTHEERIRTLMEREGTAAVYGENFSLGMVCFLRVVEEAARLFGQLPQYDVSGIEKHHRQKADAPSGTAASIARMLLDSIPSKSKVIYDRPAHEMAQDTIHFASLRTGHNPGEHAVIFDSPQDTVTLTHQARSRDGFALGALQAARWIDGRTGLFHIKEMF